jgi:hypothetical protein
MSRALAVDLRVRVLAAVEAGASHRQAGERTVDGLWSTIGKIVDLFSPAECANDFGACGYDPD